MIAYIVCEGISDAQLLQQILPKELLNDVEIVAAGGLSAIKSLARSLIVRRQLPVLIVVDADSVEPNVIHERLNSIEEIVKSVAISTPVKVILAVPTIEIIFFEDIGLLSDLLEYSPSQAQKMMNLAKSQPDKAIHKFLKRSQRNELINQLTDDNLEILRKVPFIQEIIYFLQSVQETVKV
jgi:predicted ATP-dependent endonuclease of OLD family